jgi:hypothetical protein
VDGRDKHGHDGWKERNHQASRSTGQPWNTFAGRSQFIVSPPETLIAWPVM